MLCVLDFSMFFIIFFISIFYFYYFLFWNYSGQHRGLEKCQEIIYTIASLQFVTNAKEDIKQTKKISRIEHEKNEKLKRDVEIKGLGSTPLIMKTRSMIVELNSNTSVRLLSLNHKNDDDHNSDDNEDNEIENENDSDDDDGDVSDGKAKEHENKDENRNNNYKYQNQTEKSDRNKPVEKSTIDRKSVV